MTSTYSRFGDEEPALRAVLERIYTAWAEHDADEFVASYATDATATLPGSYLENREAIRATMAAGFTGPLKGTKGVFKIRDIRLLGSSTAKQDDAWLVAAYQSSPDATP